MCNFLRIFKIFKPNHLFWMVLEFDKFQKSFIMIQKLNRSIHLCPLKINHLDWSIAMAN